MARDCDYIWDGEKGLAAWELEGEALALLPAGGPPMAFLLKEASGLSGDAHCIAIRFGAGALRLGRLGAEGPTLCEALWRLWLPSRARALRLDGSGEPVPFRGKLRREGKAVPFRGLLYEESFLFATEGGDLEPLFLSLAREIRFDEASYTVTAGGWEGEEWCFGALAGKTQEFCERLLRARSWLSRLSSDALACAFPYLPVAGRAALSGRMLPGRMVSLEEADAACPGFCEALRGTYLGTSPRKGEGEFLLGWADPAQRFVALVPPGAFAGAAGSGPPEAPPCGGGGPEAASQDGELPAAKPAPRGPDAGLSVWLLAGRGETWFLEALSEGDHATFGFRAGRGLPSLIGRLLSAPKVSWESLALPLRDLTGERSDYAIAARDLTFLRDLRAAFGARIIHSGFEAWKGKIA